MDLNSLIALTIWIDGWLQERRREKRSVPSHTRSSTSPPGNPGESDVTRVPTGTTEGSGLVSSGSHANGQG
jgi:hypothetical protein